MLSGLKTELKDLLQTALGPAYDHVVPVFSVLVPFVYPGQFLYWIFIVSAIAIAFLMYVAQNWKRSGVTAKGFLTFLAPREVYRHPSAWLDCKFYLVSSIISLYLKFSTFAVAFWGMFYIGD